MQDAINNTANQNTAQNTLRARVSGKGAASSTKPVDVLGALIFVSCIHKLDERFQSIRSAHVEDIAEGAVQQMEVASWLLVIYLHNDEQNTQAISRRKPKEN
jgi:hypothetical protein